MVNLRQGQAQENITIPLETLNMPEWDLGPQAELQTDLLPNLLRSGGFQTVMTSLDVSSNYLFVYTATASNTAVIINIMTKHSYGRTTLITDKRTAFTSKIVEDITQTLGISVKCAPTKHPLRIEKLETQASIKTNLKMD